MKKVADYRQHAEECRALASEARSPDHRDMLLDMATTWDALAESRVRNLAMTGPQDEKDDDEKSRDDEV